MNYHDARQRKDGRWDYTNRNDGRIYPQGYCCGWEDLSPESEKGKRCMMSQREWDKILAHKAKYHDDGHATKEEAYACYKQYLLDQRTDYECKLGGGQYHECEVCKQPTQRMANVGPLQYFHLCDEHCNRTELEKLLTVGASWGSF